MRIGFFPHKKIQPKAKLSSNHNFVAETNTFCTYKTLFYTFANLLELNRCVAFRTLIKVFIFFVMKLLLLASAHYYSFYNKVWQSMLIRWADFIHRKCFFSNGLRSLYPPPSLSLMRNFHVGRKLLGKFLKYIKIMLILVMFYNYCHTSENISIVNSKCNFILPSVRRVFRQWFKVLN